MGPQPYAIRMAHSRIRLANPHKTQTGRLGGNAVRAKVTEGRFFCHPARRRSSAYAVLIGFRPIPVKRSA